METMKLKRRLSKKDIERLQKEYEEDCKTHDFSIPEEWDIEFRKILEDAAQKKSRKSIFEIFRKKNFCL